MGIENVVRGVSQIQTGQPPGNDGAVMDLYAAKRALGGFDPYHKANIMSALSALNAPCTTTTPLMDGQFRGTTDYPSDTAVQQVCMNAFRYRPRTIPPEFESKYNYPSGSFLFILPFVWAGLSDMRFLYAFALLVMGAYIAFRMPRSLRFLVPALVLADVPLIKMTSDGQPDPMYALFLMIGYAEWTSPWLSPIFLGLAIGTKQLAWFFVPFYLLLALRRFGWKDVARRMGVMSAVFLAMNGVFIAESPSAYFSSIAGPMLDPMFPLGVGAIALFIANVIHMLPKLTFTVAEFAAWAGGVLAAARLRFLAPAAGAVLAALPLFFAWRSLMNYFYLVPLIALAIALADMQRRQAPLRA
jgi:uncharacterized membrane protein